MSALLEAALAYADLGWAVFPISATSKRPLTEHGHLDASTDVDQIRYWWLDACPDANIGIALAAIGLVGVDHDPRNDADGGTLEDLELRVGRYLPRDCSARTPSGGCHILMRVPEGRRARGKARIDGEVYRSVDVKWRGYILVEPSARPDGAGYEWLSFEDPPPVPDEWLDVLFHPAVADAEAPDLDLAPDWEQSSDPELAAEDAAALTAALRALGPRGEGRRTTFKAVRIIFHDFGLSVDDGWPFFTAWSEASGKPHSEQELHRQISRVARHEFRGKRGRARRSIGARARLLRAGRPSDEDDRLEPVPADEDRAREQLAEIVATAPGGEREERDTPPTPIARAHLLGASRRLSRSSDPHKIVESNQLRQIIGPIGGLKIAPEQAAALAVKYAKNVEPAQLVDVLDMHMPRPVAAAVVAAALAERNSGSREKDAGDPEDDAEADDEDRTEFTPRGGIAWMNRRYGWIEEVDRPIRIDDARFHKRDGLKDTLANRKVRGADDVPVPLFAHWMASSARASYARVGLWAPPRPTPPRALNLWRGFTVEPAGLGEPGDWSLFRCLIRDVIAASNPALDDYVVRWMAWLVQNPGLPAEAALVLRGGEGIGKGTFGNALCKLFGVHARHVTRPDHFVASKFNAHLAACSFFFADECYWAGDKAHEGALKGMITEHEMFVEPKGIDAYQVDNQLHLLLATNNRWAVPAGADSRRFVVSDVPATRRSDHDFFARLRAQLADGGLAGMLRDLLALDLGNWHPRKIVETDALRAQRERSLPPESAWTLELLRDGALPRTVLESASSARKDASVPVGWVSSEAVLDHARGRGLAKVSAERLFEALRAFGATQQRAGKNRTRGWLFPTLLEARRLWCERHFVVTWDDELDWS